MLTQDDPPSTGNDGPCTHAYHIPADMSVEMTVVRGMAAPRLRS